MERVEPTAVLVAAKFGEAAREVLERAAQEAAWLRSSMIGVDHIGLALTELAADLVASMGRDPRRWRDKTVYYLGLQDGVRSARTGGPVDLVREGHAFDVDDAAVTLLEQAAAEATEGGHLEPSLAHLLAGVLRVDGSTAGANGRDLGLTAAGVRAACGLPPQRRVLAQGAGPDASRRPAPPPVTVLLGGGPSDAALPTALAQVAHLVGVEVPALRVAVIGAASHGGGAPASAGCRGGWTRSMRASTTVRLRAKVPNGLLDGAHAVFVTGGDVAQAYDALWGTRTADALAAFADRGGIAVGVSAGAMLWGCGALSSFVTEGDPEPIPALGWLASTIVTAHHMPPPRDTRLNLDPPFLTVSE